MTPTRNFLDWNEAILPHVTRRLLPDTIAPPVDLSDTLVVVPTRQAGRRLREALARACADHDVALIPPMVREPLFFLSSQPVNPPVAGPLIANAIWSDILQHLNLVEYAGLFPTRPPRQDQAWALRMADGLQRVRATLVEGGFLIRDVVETHADKLEEYERWQDMARVESHYLDRLAEAGLQDRAAYLIAQANTPQLPNTIRRIVVAAVPDPSLLMIQALESLSSSLDIDVWIHAPETEADAFDRWGRPLRATWAERPIDIPDEASQLLAAATPLDQARKVMHVIAEEAAHVGPGDFAIGVPDAEVAPYIESELAAKGLTTFNPAGTPYRRHRLFQCLRLTADLLTDDPPYKAVATFVRHPDILRAIHAEQGLAADMILRDLDDLQNTALPETWTDLLAAASRLEAGQRLQPVLNWINTIREARNADSFEASLSHIAPMIYAHQDIDPQEPEHESFIALANRLNRLALDTRHPFLKKAKLSISDIWQRVLKEMINEAYYTEKPNATVDLEGWLELHWNDAPLLIVTGMNEGCVPDSYIGDLFLPDTLLVKLGLRSDADRVARDAYLMTAMMASRKAKGRVTFIVGSISRTGDPLRPSRLLFRCSDELLAPRAARLLAEPESDHILYPASVSFTLDPLAHQPLRIPEKVSVTALNSYLSCPYRFYLRNVLRLESYEADKNELDALDFGNLAHKALRSLETHPDLRDADDLAACFVQHATAALQDQFGAHPPLTVRIQFESLKQRLRAAADKQAECYREGWVPQLFEQRAQMTANGIRITGYIDRADYHEETDTWRIIDYKTRETREPLDAVHWGPVRDDTPKYAIINVKDKQRRWLDLQLPLYAALLAHLKPEAKNIRVALFQLPRAVTETGIDEWMSLTDETVQSALDCANGICADIAQGRFWPPVDKAQYEDFACLFPFAPIDCLSPWPHPLPEETRS